MEKVVLLDDDGTVVGSDSKALVHTTDTRLHLAFSCYVFNTAGEVLLTQRALDKRTFPGCWTNTCCGHPEPGEAIDTAIERRLREELGLAVSDLRVVLPGFRYRAVMDSGIVENEICPVFMATAEADPVPCPSEVADFRWLAWSEFLDYAADPASGLSPWARLQSAELRLLSGAPDSWEAAEAALLPRCVTVTPEFAAA
ncbi:isopentenyl-diphosphate Delta-isomerase [Nocardia sp. NPDC055053]